MLITSKLKMTRYTIKKIFLRNVNNYFDNRIFNKYDYLIYNFKNAFVSKFFFFNHNQWFLNYDTGFNLCSAFYKKTIRWHRGNGWRTFYYQKYHKGFSLKNFQSNKRLVKFRSKKKKTGKKKKAMNFSKKQRITKKKTSNYFFFKNLNYKNIIFV